ncbi:hypothetical protein Tco_1297135 [Tanacetum coccineum]
MLPDQATRKNMLELYLCVTSLSFTTLARVQQNVEIAIGLPKGTDKATKSRTLVMRTNFNPPSQILNAQTKAIKEENVGNENLRSIDKEFETRPDRTHYIKKTKLVTMFWRIKRSIPQQVSAPSRQHHSERHLKLNFKKKYF